MLDVIELTKRMVAFNTESKNSNMEMALSVKATLEDMGFSVQLHEKDYFPKKEESENDRRIREALEKFTDELGFSVQRKQVAGTRKANLIARIGPRDAEPFMLSGHMDVMPVGNVKDWKTNDPLKLTEFGKKGEWYGRGSVDMKGPIAALICAVEPLVKQVGKFKRELMFGLTHDEEVGLKGAKRMVKDQIVRPRFILIAEPTELIPIRMHKGHLCLKAICQGETGHASKPGKGINAIELAAKVIAELRKFSEELKGVIEPITDVPYTTLNISSIDSTDTETKAKAKSNEIPWTCTIEFAVRPIVGQSTGRIRAYLQDRLSRVMWDRKKGNQLVTVDLSDRGKVPTEPMCAPLDSELVRVAERVSKKSARGASYSTDASVLQKLGSDCLIFGPGSIDVAHKPNEYIEKSQLLKGVENFREIVRAMCIGEKS